MTRLTYKQKSGLYWFAFALLVALMVTLSSCGPAHYLRKSDRALKKAIAKGAIVRPDTVYKTITIYTPKIEFDTVLRQVNFRDTLVVEKDKVITRLKYDTISRTMFVSTECPPDTVIKKVPYTVTKEIICPPKDNKWKWIALALGAVLILAVIARKLV